MPSQGPNSPTSLANDASIGTLAWASPQAAAASDNVYATAVNQSVTTVTTNLLKATGFGFSIPPDAIVEGIVVEVERKAFGGASVVSDNRVSLYKADVLQATNKAAAGAWPTTDTYATYGSATDLWGDTWTAADINDPRFGVGISANVAQSIIAYIDHIRITVYYSLPGAVGGGMSMMTQII